MTIATKHDLETYLADPATHDAALAHLQCLLDERYNYAPASGAWGIVEPNGLTRLGLTAAEAVAMGAVDRVVDEPAGPALVEVQAQACSRLQAEKWARMMGKFRDSAGHLYDVDAASLSLLNGKVTTINSGKPLPSGFVWKTAEKDANGQTIYAPHTAETLVALAFEIDDWTEAVFRASEAAQGAVMTAGNKAAVKAAEAAVVWP